MSKKILVFVGGRANYGRLKSVIRAIDEHPNLELQLILGASYYNEDIGYKVDARIQCLCSGDDNQSMVITASNMLLQVSHELVRLKPDIVLVHGDRFEVLPVAQAAYYMNIPIAHTEGGEYSGCIDDGIRRMISSISTYDFVTTERALDNLQLMRKDNVFVVGSTGIDNLNGLDLSRPIQEEYFLILYHPDTSKSVNSVESINQMLRIDSIIEKIRSLDSNEKIHGIWINPNIDAGSRSILRFAHTECDRDCNITFVKDLSPEEYYRYLANCKVAIGNSSSFIKEGSFLQVPVIMIGDRQKDRERGNNIFYSFEEYVRNIKNIKYRPIYKYQFGNGDAGKKIAEILGDEIVQYD